MVKPVEMTGERFGKLLVEDRGESDASGKARWWCLCECGRRKLVRAMHLKQQSVRSCGECGAAHQTGIDPNAIRYECTVWSGPEVTGPHKVNYGPWSWGEVIDATTRELVFRTSQPQNRSLTKGEMHPCASRCMVALAQNRLIGPENMRTFKRWCVEERVTVSIRKPGDDRAVTAAWYAATGETPPPDRASRQQDEQVIGTPAVLTEDEVRQVMGLGEGE